MEKLDLQKAKGKSLAAHFKKNASYHSKMAGHHEACMKAHEGAQSHHEGMMGKAEDAMHGHHKTKAAYHKTMAAQHDKMHKTHAAHADHHAAMATAHNESATDDAKKAAYAALEIELEPISEEGAAPVVKATEVDPAEPVVVVTPAAAETVVAAADPAQGEPPVSKTVVADPNAAVVVPEQKTPVAAAAAAAATADGDPLGVQKVFREGLLAAAQNGVKELLASPEFKKTMQEEIANALLAQLGQQTQAAAVKTFAVPRAGTSVLEVAKAIQTGNTPHVDTTGVPAELAHLVAFNAD